MASEVHSGGDMERKTGASEGEGGAKGLVQNSRSAVQVGYPMTFN